MTLQVLKRSLSISFPSNDASSDRTVFSSMNSTRKGSLPSNALPGRSTLTSDGIKFDTVPADQRKDVSRATSAADKFRSPVKLMKARRKAISTTAAEQQPAKKQNHLSSFMPNFSQSKTRYRSESCGASNAVPYIRPEISNPTPIAGPSRLAQSTLQAQPRPRMVRKASSAGDLGSLLPYNAIVPLGQEPPTVTAVSSQHPRSRSSEESANPVSPLRKPRYESLQASPSPARHHPKAPISRPRQSSYGEIHSQQNQMLSPQKRAYEHSRFASQRRSPRPGFAAATQSEPLQISMQSSQGSSQTVEWDLGADGATIILKTAGHIALDWKCVNVPGSSGSQWEIRIKKTDHSRTPIPFSPSTFSNTPSLSPASLRTSSPSPTPATPAFQSGQHHSVPPNWGRRKSSATFSDPFSTQEPTAGLFKNIPWSPSSHTQDGSSGSESPPLPTTPKRPGFMFSPSLSNSLADDVSPRTKPVSHFESQLLTPAEERDSLTFMMQDHFYGRSPPATPLSSAHSKRTTATIANARPQPARKESSGASDEEDEDEWDGYADILEQANRLSGDSFKPSGLMLVPPPAVKFGATSALAKRRLGNGKALELSLDLSPAVSPSQEVAEVSRWSETEGGESEMDDDASFSCNSRPVSASLM